MKNKVFETKTKTSDDMFKHNMQTMNKMIEVLRYVEHEDYKQLKARESAYQMKKFVAAKTV